MSEKNKKAPIGATEQDLNSLIDELIAPAQESGSPQSTPSPAEAISGAVPAEPGSVAVPPPAEQALEVQATSQVKIPDKKDIIKEDPLIKGILNDDGVFDLLDVVLAELAEESASLKYERIKRELKDQDTDRLSLRRSNILKMISDALVQKRNLALNDFINLRSPQWQIVFDQLMKRVRKTFSDLQYSSEELELFFQKLQSNLEGFEEMTELKLKESINRQD